MSTRNFQLYIFVCVCTCVSVKRSHFGKDSCILIVMLPYLCPRKLQLIQGHTITPFNRASMIWRTYITNDHLLLLSYSLKVSILIILNKKYLRSIYQHIYVCKGCCVCVWENAFPKTHLYITNTLTYTHNCMWIFLLFFSGERRSAQQMHDSAFRNLCFCSNRCWNLCPSPWIQVSCKRNTWSKNTLVAVSFVYWQSLKAEIIEELRSTWFQQKKSCSSCHCRFLLSANVIIKKLCSTFKSRVFFRFR